MNVNFLHQYPLKRYYLWIIYSTNLTLFLLMSVGLSSAVAAFINKCEVHESNVCSDKESYKLSLALPL